MKSTISNPTIKSKTDFDLDIKSYTMVGGKVDGIIIDEEDKNKTAFVTHHGLFGFKRMLFGLRNAPSTFQ